MVTLSENSTSSPSAECSTTTPHLGSDQEHFGSNAVSSTVSGRGRDGGGEAGVTSPVTTTAASSSTSASGIHSHYTHPHPGLWDLTNSASELGYELAATSGWNVHSGLLGDPHGAHHHSRFWDHHAHAHVHAHAGHHHPAAAGHHAAAAYQHESLISGLSSAQEFWSSAAVAAAAAASSTTSIGQSSASGNSGGNSGNHVTSNGTTGRTRKSGKSTKKRRRVATVSQRRAANIRERRRMFNLNEAFDRLRTKVPTFAYEKRLSRIETLRLAITYISFMDELIVGGHPSRSNNNNKSDCEDGTSPTSSSLASAAAALGLRPPHPYMYPALHHGVCH